MMFESKAIRLGQGGRFHMRIEDGILHLNYTSAGCANKAEVNLNGLALSKKGIAAYCDEIVELSNANLYRIRDKIVLKQK